MKITTSKTVDILVKTSSFNYTLNRGPLGLIKLTRVGGYPIELPSDLKEAKEIIEAYKKILDENSLKEEQEIDLDKISQI